MKVLSLIICLLSLHPSIQLIDPKCYPRAIGGRCGPLAFDCDPAIPKQMCIPITSVRNCVRDCPNGSDELCGEGETLCDTIQDQCGHCVPKRDVQRLCVDQRYIGLCGEPETVKCERTENCIFTKWLADGEDDCGDGSDEDPCERGLLDCDPESTTPFHQETITTQSTRREMNMTSTSISPTNASSIITTSTKSSSSIDDIKACPPLNFQCNSGECVPFTSILDGKNDCVDKSDEIYCSMEESSCPPTRPCSFQPDVASFGCGCPHGWNRTEEGKCWEMTTTVATRRPTSSPPLPPTTTTIPPPIQPIQALVQHGPQSYP